ncbi:MAG: zinc metallopeptidase [Acidobacteriota bacterium]|nr:zinc metallopeptidase [Acidobacteriota bacterium]
MEGLFYLLAGAVFLFSLVVRRKLSSTYQKWGRTRNRANITGAQTSMAILEANDMRRVRIGQIRGKLKDHYDPRNKTIRLSDPVYEVPSVAAMAVAAHETGHAIQDKVDYAPLEIRTFLAPVAAAGARFGLPAAIVGSFLGTPTLVLVGLLAYAGALLLQLLTLPVEFNASKRAMRQLEKLGVMGKEERKGVREVLRAAAMTYGAGAASSAGYVIYLLIIGGNALLRRPALASPPLKPPPALF